MPIIDREKERQIVQQGIQQGKDQVFIKQAVLRFRKQAQPQQEEGFFKGVAREAISVIARPFVAGQRAVEAAGVLTRAGVSAITGDRERARQEIFTGVEKLKRKTKLPFLGEREFGARKITTPFGLKEKTGFVTVGADVALSVAPIEKLLAPIFKPIVKVAAKAAKPLLRPIKAAVKGVTKKIVPKIGEILTGVPADVIKRFSNKVKTNPAQIARVKDLIAKDVNQPFFGLVDDIAKKAQQLKVSANTAFTEAVESVKTRFPGKVFNLENKLSEMNKALNKFRLQVKQKRILGKLTGQVEVTPTTRTSPFTKKELGLVDDLVQKMRIKDMSVDELLDFDESVKSFFDFAVKQPTKKLQALAFELVGESRKFIDDVLPEVNQANKMFSEFFDITKKLSSVLKGTTGELKEKGAESFVSNVVNVNKGAIRKDVISAGKKLGIDIIDEVQIVKDVSQLVQLVPNTVRNRHLDFVKGALVAGGLATGNATTVVGAVLVNVITTPNRFRTFIELISKPRAKGLIKEGVKNTFNKIIQQLPKDEGLLLQNIIKAAVQQQRGVSTPNPLLPRNNQ